VRHSRRRQQLQQRAAVDKASHRVRVAAGALRALSA